MLIRSVSAFVRWLVLAVCCNGVCVVRVDGVPLRILYASMKHFKQSPKHGFAGVPERFVVFYEISDVCDLCLSLMDEIDLEHKLSG